MPRPPQAWFTEKRTVLALASLPFLIGIIWGIYQVTAVVTALNGRGSPLAMTFLVSLLLLWWVPLSWLEKPHTANADQQAKLDGLVVTVHVPVYNEDPSVLKAALESILAQTRLPNRIQIVDDGSKNSYEPVRSEFLARARGMHIDTVWARTENQGKRNAQMTTLAKDNADIFVTLDSDSTLDRRAIAEGLKPFADPRVTSVAGMIVVWNSRTNFLTRLTCMLYTPFTRGFRSAQSVLGQVLVNSGTLAFYRAAVVRKYAGVYENETFMGQKMQMNDDSMEL
jgi:hyaluronan synthase